MAVKDFAVGEVLTSSDVDVWLSRLAVVKSANESVTSSATLQDDDELTLTVATNSTYEVDCLLKYDGATTGDLKFQFVIPASASFDFRALRLQTGASDPTAVALEYGNQAGSMGVGCIGSGTTASCDIHGTLITAGTGGTFKLQWAQNTSDATATRIFARSFLKAVRIS